MPHHRLVPVGRHDSYADEILLKREEDGTEHTLSLHEARDIPEELLELAHDLAGKVGLRVIEADAPGQAESEGQEPGVDAASGSPVVKKTAESTSEIDQQAQAGRAAQQDTADAGATGGGPATTTGGGSPASSATSVSGASGTAGTSGSAPTNTP